MLFVLSLLVFVISILIISTISDYSRNLKFSKAIALTTSLVQKVFIKGNSSSNQEIIIVKTSFFTKLEAKLTSPETVISIVFTVLFGMASRYFILSYWDIDVFKELINCIAICHFTVLAIVRSVIQLLLEHLEINKLVLSMNSGGGATGGSTGNQQTGQGTNVIGSGQPAQAGDVGQPAQAGNVGQPVNLQPAQAANYWGDPNQPVAGVANGPIDVHDPQGQLTRGYIIGGVNQPVLDNIGSALEDQFLKGRGGPLSRAMFTREQERFILAHLRETNHSTWLRIMGVWGYQGGPPRWRNVGNTAEFRSNFWIN